MRVAVGETVAAQGKSGGGETGASCARRCFTVFSMRHAAFAVLVLSGLAPVFPQAQIVPSGPHAPNVVSTANGLPQVNVTKPSGAGVSLNTYSQFDVQRNGAILNNSPVITNTQLAGQINGNPNFRASDAARIIVNQVNSHNPSQLRGHVEVAGQRTAAVVIANPSGLVVDGGGFINTARGVLTTGNPLFDASGNLTGFNVAQGDIAVQGAGFNASNIDQADLIARAVNINAAIHAGTLNVVTGANHVDFAGLDVTPIAGTGVPHGVSIDVAQLGGMYADRIVLVGTGKGVGVANAGTIAAQAGDFILTTSGQLVHTGSMTAGGNVSINASGGVDSAGSIFAQLALRLASDSGALASSGVLAAQGGELALATGGQIHQAGEASAGANVALAGAAGVANSGTTYARQATLVTTDGIYAGDGGFSVSVKGNTDLTGAVISGAADPSKNSLTTGTLTYSDITNSSSYIASSGGISAGGSIGSSGKAVGPASVPDAGGVTPMMGQSDGGNQTATTRTAVSAGVITITDGANQTQDMAALSRDTTNANGTVSKTPDVGALLERQSDMMDAAGAAGQVVAQGIGEYAAKRFAETGDEAWAEGGANRTALHIAGGALIGGLGGGSFGTALQGAAGAGLAAKMADELDQISKGVGSATGSELLGNLTANVVAGLGGALVGGTAGAATASNVELYNQSMHRKKDDLVSQVCPAGAQCSDAVLDAAIQAQGYVAQVAQKNVADTSLVVVGGVGMLAAAAVGPEAYAAYKAAQAGYSLTTAATTGTVASGVTYTGVAAAGAAADAFFRGANFSDSFGDRFSVAGLAAASLFGAYSNMFATSMYGWAGVPNSIENVSTIPGIVIRGTKLALGQTVGRATQAIVDSDSSKD